MNKLSSYHTEQLAYHRRKAYQNIAHDSHATRRVAYGIRISRVQMAKDVSMMILADLRDGHG